jgi:hypothetical protein
VADRREGAGLVCRNKSTRSTTAVLAVWRSQSLEQSPSTGSVHDARLGQGREGPLWVRNVPKLPWLPAEKVPPSKGSTLCQKNTFP